MATKNPFQPYGRRHMTQHQLALTAARSLPDAPIAAAARAVGVSGRTLQRARALLRAAPDIAEQAWTGELSMRRAERLAGVRA